MCSKCARGLSLKAALASSSTARAVLLRLAQTFRSFLPPTGKRDWCRAGYQINLESTCAKTSSAWLAAQHERPLGLGNIAQ